MRIKKRWGKYLWGGGLGLIFSYTTGQLEMQARFFKWFVRVLVSTGSR